jgi:HD-GYP domain-containing protein (c-di-GMP phosphodiesterase class II)
MYHSSPQVLVIEPDAARQTALAVWLEGAGYDCVPVSDAEEAFAIAEDDEADVALVSSPGAAWSASHLAVALQSRAQDLPVIVVRGTAEPRRNDLHSRVGSLEEIPAPLTRGRVMQAISRALEWRDASSAQRAEYLDFERFVAGQIALVREACLAGPCSASSLAEGLMGLLDRSVAGAGCHATGVAAVAREVGASIGMTADGVAALALGASLHDFGRALLPPALRRQPAALGRLERAFVGRHPEFVFELLSGVPLLQDVASLVLCSHERFDGRGFPRGLSGLEIPLGARIITLANAIQTLREDQDGATSPSFLASDLVRRAGSEFDPDLVRVWLRLVNESEAPRLH